ncbi:MAG: hypothetical protein R3F19_12640 [Verrucomicrobiales bacterium]
MYDNRKIVSIWQRLIGYQHITALCERQLCWIRSVTSDHRHALIGNGNSFDVVVNKRDLHFAICSYEKLCVWLNASDDTPAIWAGYDLCVIMIGVIFVSIVISMIDMVFVSIGVTVGVFFVIVVIFVIVLFATGGEAVNCGEADCYDGQFNQFHGFLDLLLVYGSGGIDLYWSVAASFILVPLTPVLLFIRWRRGVGTRCLIPASLDAFRETLKRPASGGVIALGLVMAGDSIKL